ncbi:uncharacterized protein LOC117322874 [Pecten maximus]|uniref:uncharacterized protein LOC117322874 n=1 Tax=Pecten maximus TaxID=6579 RepID=UPI001458BD01|nr:uncharacterized protein LOC117322874 [Pecten maximus]
MSEYFKILLQMDGKDKTAVELHDMDYDSLELLLHYAYTGNVTITDRNVQSLFVTADYLQMLFVKESCEKFMIQNMKKDNCIAILQFAAFYTINKLKEACSAVIGRDLKYASKLDEFAEIPYDTLLEILTNDHLVVFHNGFPMCHSQNEMTILGAALMYISGQKRSKLSEGKIYKLLTAARLSKDNASEELQELAKRYKHLLPKDYDPMALAAASGVERSRTDTSSHIIPHRRGFSIGGEVHPICRYFDGRREKIHYETSGLSKMIFVTRLWDGWTVVGGLHVFDGKWNFNGLKPGEKGACDSYTVELNSSEVIVKIIVRCGWVINCLTLVTSSGRKLGPYGGDVGGDVHVAVPPRDKKGFLHSFSGAEVHSQGCLTITCLAINWTCFTQT